MPLEHEVFLIPYALASLEFFFKYMTNIPVIKNKND